MNASVPPKAITSANITVSDFVAFITNDLCKVCGGNRLIVSYHGASSENRAHCVFFTNNSVAFAQTHI